MKLSVTLFIFFISICIINASLLEPVIENVVHIKASASNPNGAPGTWKKKTVWKPRWVKEWKSAKVMKPTYRKVWSPVLIKEWIPFPKPPPEWDNKSTPLKPVTSEFTGPMPLWDPMPYPESQQPPPAGPSTPSLSSFPISPGGPGGLGGHRGPGGHEGSGGHGSSASSEGLGFPGIYAAPDGAPVGPFFKGTPHCHHPGCNSPSLTFTQEQISQIIGHNRHKKETNHTENNKFPEPAPDSFTLQSASQNWRSRRQSSLAFNLLQGLSQFLLPPKIMGFNYQSKPAEPPQPPKRTNNHSQPVRPPNHVRHNGFRQTSPISTQNKPPPPPNSHHHSSSLQQSNSLKKPNSPPKNANPNAFPKKSQPNYQPHQPLKNPNLIQSAELVSEYHYSEFDVTRPTNPPQPVDNLKFKPLPPSMWTLPSATASIPYDNQQSQGGSVLAKPRPIRKHPEQLQNLLHNSHQAVTPAPAQPLQLASTATFEQEKAITKEIVSMNNISPIPFQANHKDDSETNYKGKEKENPLNAIDNPLEPKLEGSQNRISNMSMKQPTRLSEEALLNAIQNNRTATQRTTTPWYQSNTSSLSDSDNSEVVLSSTTTTAKSPVYIVTPIYQTQTN